MSVNTNADTQNNDLFYKKFVKNIEFDSTGRVTKFELDAPDDFNFAYDVADEMAKQTPEKCAVYWVNDKGVKKEITFKELKEESDKEASFLMQQGIKKGDCVILLLKRHYTYWYSYLALHKIGAIVVPATTMLQVKDIVYRIEAANLKGAIATTEGEIISLFDIALDECRAKGKLNGNFVKVATGGGREKEGWLNLEKEMETAPPFVRPQGDGKTKAADTMILFFTSGTTGMPKMVIHDFYYPLGHIFTAIFWHKVENNGLHITVADTGWAKTAWGKMYGQWMGGSAQFIYDHEKFNAKEMLEVISKHKVTTFCAPPTVYKFFIKEDLSKYDLSSLTHASIAGEALNPEVFNKFKEATGISLMEGFGQTENIMICCNQYMDTPKPGSMGRPNPMLTVDIVDDNNESVQPGVNGEIVIKVDRNRESKFYGMFMEYMNDEELTNESWHDGYYHTGDIAWKDEDNYYWFVGRKDDIIKSSGYRIGPFEVESVIMEHPGVLECAVIGVPDEIRGQLVKAFIVLTNGYEKSEGLAKEIQNYVKTHTAPYKYPRLIEFVDVLPKTISGKVRRVEMRAKE